MENITKSSSEFLRAVREGIVWIDRSERVRLSFTGPDRAKLLQNLTTQDVLNIPIGAGGEAFVTNPQGKTIGFLTLLVDEETIQARGDEGALELLAPHFQKYGLFDDARFEDLSQNTFEIHCAGPGGKEFLAKIVDSRLNEVEYSHIWTRCLNHSVRIVRESPSGLPGFTIIGASAEREEFFESFRDAIESFGGLGINRERFDALRIEAGTPVFGRDVSAANLPQEIGRDEQTLNFRKGCYLGQETVARLDALGHVNKVLKRGRIPNSREVPVIGAALESLGQVVGNITSAAFSEISDAAVFLAFVKRIADENGAELSVVTGNRRARAVLVESSPSERQV